MRWSVAVLGALGALAPSPAFADDRPCSGPAVDADADVLRRWPDLAAGVREAFGRRDDVDACARIKLTANSGAIVAAVTLPDGRLASRRASLREDVVPALEALLLLPQGPTPTPSPSPDPPPPSPPGSRATLDVPLHEDAAVPRDDALAKRPTETSGRPRIELSVVTSAHTGEGQTSIGLGAQSFLDLGGWLAGFAGRLDRYQSTAVSAPDAALELAVMGGHRFRFGGLAVDLLGGPAVALRATSETSESRPAAAGTVGTTTETTSGNDVVPRLILGARLNFGARSVLRTFVGLDAEIGPAYGADANPVDGGHVRPLPMWTLGLALGATVGSL